MNENAPPLAGFKALTFDCYGTLIDWETGIWDAFQPLILLNGGAGPGRKTVLEAFAVHENRIEHENPGVLYPDVLARVHDAIARQMDLDTSADLDRDFGRSLPHWPAFPDSAEALRSLKKHYKLVILSNVDRGGFAASNRKLGVAPTPMSEKDARRAKQRSEK